MLSAVTRRLPTRCALHVPQRRTVRPLPVKGRDQLATPRTALCRTVLPHLKRGMAWEAVGRREASCGGTPWQSSGNPAPASLAPRKSERPGVDPDGIAEEEEETAARRVLISANEAVADVAAIPEVVRTLGRLPER